MSSLLTNPLSFSPEREEVEGDKTIGYFLTKREDNQKVVLNYLVKPNASLNLTLADVCDADMDFVINVDMMDHSTCHIYLASIALKNRDKTFVVNVNHLEGNTYSRTQMAGINAGSGHLNLLGSSFIKNGAHKSDTRQEGKITNLSKDAKSNVSPALLIKDNDVNASHGAALGAYNEDDLFYLMSRGLTMEESKKLITYGSLLPIIETLHDEKTIEEFKKALGDLDI